MGVITMKKLLIRGGVPLCGETEIAGFKNAALPILYATVLCGEVSVIENLPRIRDVLLTLEILKAMGAVVLFIEPHTVMIDTRHALPCRSPDGMVSGLRASSYLLGAELGRFGKTRAAIPGGCRIGARPLDLHVLAFTALGADITCADGAISATAPEGLCGGEIAFPTPSVGATVNAILASVMAPGKTRITGAAKEPHIVDLCTYLTACGAKIDGAGSGELLVHGGKRLSGARHRLMPDMIEAGTFLTAVGAAGGEILLRGADERHLASTVTALCGMGMQIGSTGEGLLAKRRGGLSPCRLIAEPYPGIPTDMHPQIAAMATVADGESRIADHVFPGRFGYAAELCRMGAQVSVREGEITVLPSALRGAHVSAVDLRAGAAEVVAALAAHGRTVITESEVLERGYEDLGRKLTELGATVEG